jgi:hypothetical protein
MLFLVVTILTTYRLHAWTGTFYHDQKPINLTSAWGLPNIICINIVNSISWSYGKKARTSERNIMMESFQLLGQSYEPDIK